MSRRLSAIKFAHRLRDLPDPTENARVVAVWEGIRREHSTKTDQARPLMPPQLWDVLEACPTTKTFQAKNRPDEVNLAGLRDRALILIGFVAALRRSEIAALDLSHLSDHPNGPGHRPASLENKPTWHHRRDRRSSPRINRPPLPRHHT